MSDKGQHYMTQVSTGTERHKIKIAMECPKTIHDTPTEKEIVLARLGMDRKRLYGEAVRHAVQYGGNIDRIESDFPIHVLQDGVDAEFDNNPDADRIVDKAFSSAVDAMAINVSDIARLPAIQDAAQEFHARFTPDTEVEVKSVTELPSGDGLVIELEARRDIIGTVRLPPKGVSPLDELIHATPDQLRAASQANADDMAKNEEAPDEDSH